MIDFLASNDRQSIVTFKKRAEIFIYRNCVQNNSNAVRKKVSKSQNPYEKLLFRSNALGALHIYNQKNNNKCVTVYRK